MRNISINQFIIVVFVGILLFTDFSKILKNVRKLLEKNEIYKMLKKK
jgi:hypothetical protein